MATNRKTAGVRRLLAGGLVALTLSGCMTAPQPTAARYGSDLYADNPQYGVMAGILNVLALPLYIPLKIVVCAATVAFAAPATAVTALTDPHGTGWQRQDLAEGFATNCGVP